MGDVAWSVTDPTHEISKSESSRNRPHPPWPLWQRRWARTSIWAASRPTIAFAFCSLVDHAVSRSPTSVIAALILGSRPRCTSPFLSLRMESATWTWIMIPRGLAAPTSARQARRALGHRHIHRQRLKVAHRYALIPNVLCVAGAFVWGFTSLVSVVVTNLATYSIYSRTSDSIRSLEYQISRSLSPRQFLSRRRP